MKQKVIQQQGAHENTAASCNQTIGSNCFPPSVQSDLFNYLKPEQQEFVKPILRVIKKKAQPELCSALLDYLEKGIVLPPDDLVLGALFYYITRTGEGFEDDPNDRRILRPLSHQN